MFGKQRSCAKHLARSAKGSLHGSVRRTPCNEKRQLVNKLEQNKRLTHSTCLSTSAAHEKSTQRSSKNDRVYFSMRRGERQVQTVYQHLCVVDITALLAE